MKKSVNCAHPKSNNAGGLSDTRLLVSVLVDLEHVGGAELDVDEAADEHVDLRTEKMDP